MKISRFVTVTTLFFVLNLSACSLFQPSFIERNAFAELVFVAPENNIDVQSPVNIQLRMNDLQLLKNKHKEAYNTHIHVLINTPVPALDRAMPHKAGSVVEIESGKGSIELSLPPGTHKLQLIAADEWHRPHLPPLISEIRTITVTD